MAGDGEARVVHAAPLWEVRAPGHSSSHATQQLAMAAARDWLHRNDGGELVVEDEQGRVLLKDVLAPH